MGVLSGLSECSVPVLQRKLGLVKLREHGELLYGKLKEADYRECVKPQF